MSNGFDQQPVGLRPPRVPFDLRCVILAALGYLTFLGADWLLGLMLNETRPMSKAAVMAADLLRLVPAAVQPPDLGWWKVLIAAASFFAIWGFFGGALMRTAALRLTRDEPLTLGQGLTFGCKNWLTYLCAPVVVILFAGFFVLCNFFVGLLLSIWGVGSSILVIVLFPLAAIAALLITLSVLGGLATIPLMWAAISVEQNGALEAVSRTFSYLFARPFHFFFGAALLTMLTMVVLFAASHYEGTLKQTLQAGVLRADLDDLISREPRTVGQFQTEYENKPKTVRQQNGISDIRNHSDAAWYDWIGFVWMWLMISAFMLCFKGYAIYVLLGGTVSLYLQLRREVDGAPESEIYPPLDDIAEATGAEPKWVGDAEPPKDDAPAGE